jgi:hypothetical protein
MQSHAGSGIDHRRRGSLKPANLTAIALTLAHLRDAKGHPLGAEGLVSRFREDAELSHSHFWSMLESPKVVRFLCDPSSATRPPVSEVDRFTWSLQWREASLIWKEALAKLAIEREISRERLLSIIFEWIATLAADGES